MRKSVLALAMEEVKTQETVALASWWSTLHVRSRAVVTSKMRSRQPATAIRLVLPLRAPLRHSTNRQERRHEVHLVIVRLRQTN